MALANLCAGSGQSKDSVRECGGAPVLITLLAPGHSAAVHAIAASALRALRRSNPQNRNSIRRCGGVAVLVGLRRRPRRPQARGRLRPPLSALHAARARRRRPRRRRRAAVARRRRRVPRGRISAPGARGHAPGRHQPRRMSHGRVGAPGARAGARDAGGNAACIVADCWAGAADAHTARFKASARTAAGGLLDNKAQAGLSIPGADAWLCIGARHSLSHSSSGCWCCGHRPTGLMAY